jgi:sugar lactone lactonase YvrE
MRTGIAVANASLSNAVRVGEGPHWSPGARTLHWVDILAGSIHTSDLTTGHTSTLTVPTLVGAAVPRREGGFVAATAEGFGTVDSRGVLDRRLVFLPNGIRMNDAKCDVRGRLWAGSTALDFRTGEGRLHVLLPDWSTRVVLDGLTLPNGLGWSPDGRTFYLIDSIAGELYAFDTYPDRVVLAHRRVLYAFPAEMGLPDGLTVDSAGCIWVALWGGSRVVRISPDGDLIGSIEMPVRQPSSCAFGGQALDTLYITSAREGLDLDARDLDGSVFALAGLGVTGVAGAVFGG